MGVPAGFGGRIRGAFLALAFGLFALAGTPQAQAGYASFVMDAQTGQIFHARNADTRNFPASLTKIMTLFMVFEALDTGKLSLDQRLPVSRRAAGQTPSKLGLKVGQTVTVDAAIRALSVKSANDVATVVAEAIGGTEIKFAQMMTRRARALGMSRTTFKNASGLPNRGQLSTARDMAILAKEMLDRFPARYAYFSDLTFKYGTRTFSNHNKLLRTYDGMDGIKTGYIRASGYNLVASVERNGHRLVGVVFGGRTGASRDKHMIKLLDRGFDHYKGGDSLIQEAFKSIEMPSLIASAHAATPAIVPVPRPRPTSGVGLLAHALSPRGEMADGTAFSTGMNLGREAAIGQVAQGDAEDSAGPTRLVGLQAGPHQLVEVHHEHSWRELHLHNTLRASP